MDRPVEGLSGPSFDKPNSVAGGTRNSENSTDFEAQHNKSFYAPSAGDLDKGRELNGDGVVVKNLVKSYGTFTAVNDVSFSVNEGEFFGIIGPSGCGKTTLLKCIGGLVTQDSGQIFIRGKDVAGIPSHKRDVSLVFERYALFPHMNIFDNVAFGPRMKNHGKEEVEDEVKEALELVGLAGLEKRHPHELSGGQQQRVALARSLVFRPNVLLFDEPLGNLDYPLQRQMEEDLKILHNELKLTFIYVTHNREQAISVADRILIFNHGVVEQIGTPREIYENPTSVFASRFVGDVNLIPGQIVASNGNKVVATPIGEFAFQSNRQFSVGRKVVCGVRPEKVRILNVESYMKVASGKLQSTTFFGNQYELIFKLQNEYTFKATRFGQVSVPKEGEIVGIGWNAEDLMVMDREAGNQPVDFQNMQLAEEAS